MADLADSVSLLASPGLAKRLVTLQRENAMVASQLTQLLGLRVTPALHSPDALPFCLAPAWRGRPSAPQGQRTPRGRLRRAGGEGGLGSGGGKAGAGAPAAA